MYQDRTVGLSCADGLVSAFKSLGYDVKTCGPQPGNFSGCLFSKHNLAVYDRAQHPETYNYEEILKLYQEKYECLPDLIIQTDPHFYLVGEKPKNIKSVYWIMDVHRGPNVFRNMAIAGNFDKIFISQKYYMPIFERVGLDCVYLSWAYDDDKIYEHQEIKKECDIVFIGTLGVPNDIYKNLFRNYSLLDAELNLRYYHLREFNRMPIEKHFMGWENRSFEYAERAELLIRLSNDFDVRIYEYCINEIYAKALSRARICFHHSLRRDITLRNFEVPAVNRLLIADEIPYLSELLEDKKHIVTFRSYYQPQFAGFDFDYEEVKEKVSYYLKHNSEREEIAKNGLYEVKKNHTFKNRANTILNII